MSLITFIDFTQPSLNKTDLNKSLTTMNSSPPLIKLRMMRVSECVRAGVLWREHFVGKAATVALVIHKEHESGDG